MRKFFKKKSKEPSESSPLIQANQAEVDIQSTVQTKETIFSAVKANNIEKLKEFIEQGIDVNAHDKLGYAPLHYIQSKEALDLLVKNKADVHVQSKNIFNSQNTHTPLSSACAFANYDLIEPILQHYSLSDLEKKPDYIENKEFLSEIWDSNYKQKRELQTPLSLSDSKLSDFYANNPSAAISSTQTTAPDDSDSTKQEQEKGKHTEVRLHC